MHLSRDPKDQSKRYIPIDCWKTQTNSIVTVSSAHLHLWGGSKVEGVGGLLSVRRDALHSMCHLELDVKRHMPCTGGDSCGLMSHIFFEKDVNKNLKIIIPNTSMTIKYSQ